VQLAFAWDAVMLYVGIKRLPCTTVGIANRERLNFESAEVDQSRFRLTASYALT